MSKDTVFDSTDRGTLRPNLKPLHKKGNAFNPIELPHFDPQITLPDYISSDNPIALFTLYYTPEIIELIVQKTNKHIRLPKNGDDSSRARANEWYPIYSGEIYIYFAIQIYMTLFVCNEIYDYWNTNGLTPIHPISAEMSRDRFQELYIRVQLAGNEAIGPYNRVSNIF